MRLPRYLAVVGQFDPFGFQRDIGPRMAELGLSRVVSQHGLSLYSEGPAPLLLPGPTGAILGPIFRRRGGMDTVTGFDAGESAEIAASLGQTLIESYWGNYVAFLVSDGVAVAIRPPLSDLGCLHAEHRGLRLIASDLELLSKCGVPANNLNWTEITRHLRWGGLRRPATCIAGVDELLWGNRLIAANRAIRSESCWTPWRSALAPRQCAPAQLADELREVAFNCVQAQVRHLDGVVSLLSGGLDSSILATCLAKSGVRLHCLNLPFDGANGDERIYARAVAGRLGVPLFEVEPQLGDVDITRFDTPWLPRPLARGFLQSLRDAKRRIAAATGVSDVVDGAGGDSVFCSQQSAAPVADRLLREGLSRGAFKTAADVARLTDASMIKVLALALRRAFLRRRAHRWQGDAQFLSENAIAHAGPPLHPWLATPWRALPGSASHIANMIVVENLIEIGNEAVAEWSPLMAQPLVEFCLSVPSWHWFDGGHNRALARHAFENLLPPEVAWRRDKGTPDGFVAAIFEANRERLRELLVGGSLDQAGLLDRAAIEDTLATPGPVKGHDYIRLLRIADVEAWITDVNLRSAKQQSGASAFPPDADPDAARPGVAAGPAGA